MEKPKVFTPEEFTGLTKPSTPTVKNEYSGLKDLIKEVNGLVSGVSGLMGNIQKVQELKNKMTGEEETPQGVNIRTKIEKGVERRIEQSQSKKTSQPDERIPTLKVATGKATEELLTLIKNTLADDTTTAKEIKEQLESFPREMLEQQVETFITKYTKAEFI